jgi:hypothetical protein
MCDVIGGDVLERLAWLDLSDVQYRFMQGAGATASRHVVSTISLEYRRFLLLRLTYPERNIPAPPLLDDYWRLHAADRSAFALDCSSVVAGSQLNPDMLIPPPEPTRHEAGQHLRALYETMFPYGNADLWGWPQLEPEHRNSAPALGSVHIRMPAALDESSRSALREEAFHQRQAARESHSVRYSVGKRGSVIGSCRACRAAGGPVLQELHGKDTVPRLIAAQTGAIVSPSEASYLYYRSGDFVGIHTDPYGYELVLLTLLSGSVEPLHCHLDLVETPLEEIRVLAEASGGLPAGAAPFVINNEPFLLSGQRIPHHREPMDRDTETIVLAQFYTNLLPPRSDCTVRPAV